MPTLTLQPDATAGLDTKLRESTPTTNLGADVNIDTGGTAVGVNRERLLIKFDLSTLPATATIVSATLSLYLFTENDTHAAGPVTVHRQKRAWVEGEATWNIYSTGNNWQEAGGFGADDCEAASIASLAFADAPALGQMYEWSLAGATKADLDLGNGWLLQGGGPGTLTFNSSDHTTAAQRPQLVIEYTLAALHSRSHIGLAIHI